MIVTKENGTVYTNGLTIAVINFHKDNGFTIAEVKRSLTKNEEGEYIDDITAEEVNLGTKEIREILYRTEADHLFFKVQRGEIEESVWLNKVAEIKVIVQNVEEISEKDE